MTVSSRQFSFNSTTKQLSAEISDLGPGAIIRVWPDSCDVGVEVVSEKTGAHVKFFVSHTHVDPEGDVQYYDLKPTPESLRKVPAVKGMSMILFND